MVDKVASTNLRVLFTPASGAQAVVRPILWDVSETDTDRKARFAYVLRRAREKRGMTPPQLAARLRVTRGTVNNWEDPLQKDAPSILKLGPLCKALGIEPRVFAILPPEPPSEVDDFLLVEEATEQGLQKGREIAIALPFQRRRRRAVLRVDEGSEL